MFVHSVDYCLSDPNCLVNGATCELDLNGNGFTCDCCTQADIGDFCDNRWGNNND